MDTKWKNRKKIISFLIFVLGVSMTLGGLTDILRTKPSGAKLWQVDRILEDDYQQNVRFRGYIANRLENFLIMATGGKGLGGIGGYNNGTYYGGGYDGSYYYGDFLEDFTRKRHRGCPHGSWRIICTVCGKCGTIISICWMSWKTWIRNRTNIFRRN